MENFKNSIYKDAGEYVDKTLELIYPYIRQALLEAYSQGYRECYKIYHEN